MTARKEIERVIREAEAQGWRRDDRGEKVVLYSQDGVTTVSIHWTPSDHRWRENAYRDLRRGGFVKPTHKGKGKKRGKGKR